MSPRLAFASLVFAACTDAVNLPGTPTGPTWHQDIHPMVQERCVNCHRPGGLGQALGDWTTYEGARVFAWPMVIQVELQTMPPFLAHDTDDCVQRFPFVHDTRLTPEEAALFRAWADGGAPAGDPATAASLPEPIDLSLTEWDVELVPNDGFEVPAGDDLAICWSLPPGIAATELLDALEVVPGDERVTHHISVQLHESSLIGGVVREDGVHWECQGGTLGGTDVAGWLPGSNPVLLPTGVAIPLEPTQRVSMNVHYHNSSNQPIFDKTKLRFRFATNPESLTPGIFRVGRPAPGPPPNDDDFELPAGEVVVIEELMDVPANAHRESYVFMLSNHMHAVGVDMRMWVVHDEATKRPEEPVEECLLATPRWDTTWQSFYFFDANGGQAPIIRQRDQIRTRCVFDNTTANGQWMATLEGEGLPAEPINVKMGEGFLNEMCTGMLGTVDKQALDALRR